MGCPTNFSEPKICYAHIVRRGRRSTEPSDTNLKIPGRRNAKCEMLQVASSITQIEARYIVKRISTASETLHSDGSVRREQRSSERKHEYLSNPKKRYKTIKHVIRSQTRRCIPSKNSCPAWVVPFTRTHRYPTCTKLYSSDPLLLLNFFFKKYTLQSIRQLNQVKL